MEQLTAPQADELSVLLDQINVRSVVYCLSDLGAPWGLRVDGSATAKFHLVLDGRATLTLDEPGAASAELEAGELALLPHGSGHLLQDGRHSSVRPLEHILAEAPAGAAERLEYGGDGPRTTLLCGGFALASALPENLLSLLPPLLVLDTDGTGIGPWLEPTFALLRNEIAGAGLQGGNVADGVRGAVPRTRRRAADELSGPGAARLRRRVPVGHGQDRAGDRPHGRVRERGLAVQGVPPRVRPGARRVPPPAGRRPRGTGDGCWLAGVRC
jgi:Cupin